MMLVRQKGKSKWLGFLIYKESDGWDSSALMAQINPPIQILFETWTPSHQIPPKVIMAPPCFSKKNCCRIKCSIHVSNREKRPFNTHPRGSITSKDITQRSQISWHFWVGGYWYGINRTNRCSEQITSPKVQNSPSRSPYTVKESSSIPFTYSCQIAIWRDDSPRPMQRRLLKDLSPKGLPSPLEICYHNTPYLIEVHLHKEFHLYKRTVSNRLQLHNDAYNHGWITSWQSPESPDWIGIFSHAYPSEEFAIQHWHDSVLPSI